MQDSLELMDGGVKHVQKVMGLGRPLIGIRRWMPVRSVCRISGPGQSNGETVILPSHRINFKNRDQGGSLSGPASERWSRVAGVAARVDGNTPPPG